MTRLFDTAIERVRTLSPEEQDELARILLQLAGEEQAVYHLTAEEEEDLAAADAEVARGEFADDEEVAALWAQRGH